MQKELSSFKELKLRTYNYWTLYLHEKQNYIGRSYAALHRSGSLDPFVETTPQEREELVLIVAQVQAALSKIFRPDLYNYANFRNTWPHCHWHIIPRYKAPRELEGTVFVDKNWGKNYAPYDLDFKIPTALVYKIRDSLQERMM